MKQEFFINGNGICYLKEQEKKYGDLDEECIKLCEQWITEFAKRRKTINQNVGSYRLKHVVERHFGRYISNGEFIKATINLGFNVKPDSIDANFNMGFKEKDLMNHHLIHERIEKKEVESTH